MTVNLVRQCRLKRSVSLLLLLYLSSFCIAGETEKKREWSFEPDSLTKDKDGNFYIVGMSYKYGTRKIEPWVIKCNANGEEIWRKLFATRDLLSNIAINNDGNVWVIEMRYTPSHPGNIELILLHLLPSGEIVEKMIHYGANNPVSCPLPSGGMLLVYQIGKQKGICITELDKNGELVRKQQIGIPDNQDVVSVNADGKNTQLVMKIGKFNKFGQGPSEVILAILDSELKTIHQQPIPNAWLNTKKGRVVQPFSDGYALVHSTRAVPSFAEIDVNNMLDVFYSSKTVIRIYDKALKLQWVSELLGYSMETPMIALMGPDQLFVVGQGKNNLQFDILSLKSNENLWHGNFEYTDGLLNVCDLLVHDNAAIILLESEDTTFLLKFDFKTLKVIWLKKFVPNKT